MTVVFRGDDVPAAARAEYWHHVVGETIGPHDLRVRDGFDGRDRLRVEEAGPVVVGSLSAGSPAEVRRTRRHVRRAGADLCKVHVLAAGHGVVEQDGRQAPLGPGDLVFVDLARPARWAMSPMRSVAVVFPRAALPLPADEVSGLTGVRVPGDRGAGALASALALRLPQGLDGTGPGDAVRLGTAILDLITATLAARLDTGPAAVPRAAQRRAALMQVLTFIEERLGDPGLTPGAVAAAQHMSLRSLYTLFEQQHATVAGWIRHRRLERCRRDLRDPAQAHVPVSAVGARWGLVNPAHFSRTFRAAYGLSPVEYRCLGGDQPVRSDVIAPAIQPASTGIDVNPA